MSRVIVFAMLGLLVTTGCGESPSSPSAVSPNPSSSGPLVVSGILPVTGLVGDTLRITGSGFSLGASLTLDGVIASIASTSDGNIKAFAPPHTAGAVDVVVRNLNGQTSTLTRGFTYETVTLTSSPAVVVAGTETLRVSWVAPAGRGPWDWIALIKVGEPSTTYEKGWWDYTKGVPSATLTIKAPDLPGQYEFRYHVDDGFSEVARSSAVTVR